MNQYKLAEHDYLEAKAALKKDFKIFLVLAIISVVAFVCLDFAIMFSPDNPMLTIPLCLFVGIFHGLQVICGIIGLIEGFKFAWTTFELWSIVLIFFVVGISFCMGIVITLVKFLKGRSNVRELEKALYGNNK